MKKLFCFCLVFFTMLCLPLTTHADKTKWVNPAYNFKAVKTFELTSIAVADIDQESFTQDELAYERVLGDLQNEFSKYQLHLESNNVENEELLPGYQKPIPTDTYPATTAVMQVKIHRFGYITRIIPAHQEPYTYTRKEKIRDNHGNWIVREIPVTEYRYVPAYREDSAQLDISFNIYDSQTGKLVMNLRDSRERSGDSDTSGVSHRIVQNFIKELSKKVYK